MKSRFLLMAALLLAAPAARAMDDAEAAADAADAVIERYGAGRIDSLTALTFTCARRDGGATVTRTWVWDKAAGRVLLRTPTGDRPVDDKAAAAFADDRLWLLFPAHLETDAGLDFSADDAVTPLARAPAQRLTVLFPSRGRVSGDVYDLYLDDDGLIREWGVHRAADASTRVSTWEDHRQLGPLVVSLLRRDAKGGTEVRFTDVAAKFRGSDRWVRPSPL